MPDTEKLDQQMKREAAEQGLGSMGTFSEGKLNKEDEGDIKVGLKIEGEHVILNFGVYVSWLGMTGDEAINMGEHLIQAGRSAKGGK